jgi:hypothetical protein
MANALLFHTQKEKVEFRNASKQKSKTGIL